MSSWAQGKKTYILAGFFALLVASLVCAGKLTPDLALDILAFAAPCFAATFRSALETHHSQVLDALSEIAQIGMDVKLHKPDVLAVDAEALAKIAGPALVSSLDGTQTKATGILSGGYPANTKAGS